MTDFHAACDQFGGRILNATINKYIYATLVPREGHSIVLRAPDQDQVVELPDATRLSADGELGLAQHIISQMGMDGIELTTCSEMPAGAGLGSSSTIATCIIAILDAFTGRQRSNYDIAEMAIDCERVALQTEYGWQDQYSPVTGGGVKYMVRWPATDARGIEIDVLPLPPDMIVELEKRLVVAFSGISRPAKSILDQVRQGVEDGETGVISALQGMSAAAEEMRKALLRGRLNDLGPLLAATWEHHKNLHPDVTSDRLEGLYEAAIGHGAMGGRVCGAGGGGTMLFLCEPNRELAVKQALRELGAIIFDFSIDLQGLYVWETHY